MPYEKIDDLPDSVRNNLPTHAQEIFLESFNIAWDEYKEPDERRENTSREKTAFKVDWSAVKKSYYKNKQSGKWIKK